MPRCSRSRTSSISSRRTRSGTRAPSPTWRRRPGRRLGLPEPEVRDAAPGRARARLRPPRRLERDLGQARAARRRRVGAGPAAPVPHRAHAAAVRRARAAGRDRASSTASGWTARATRAGCRARRSRGPRGSSAPPTPTRRCASRGRTGRARSADDAARAAARRRQGGAPRRGGGRRRARPRPATAVPRRREGPAGLTAREVEVLRLLALRAVEQARSPRGS